MSQGQRTYQFPPKPKDERKEPPKQEDFVTEMDTLSECMQLDMIKEEISEQMKQIQAHAKKLFEQL
ncbi:unknown [African cichlid nackednavirus]|nr:unknown [African cichlid nackednavirus]